MGSPTQVHPLRPGRPVRTAVVSAAEVTEFLATSQTWLPAVVADPTAAAQSGVVLAELLANAAQHATGPYTVTVSRGPLAVLIQVRDQAGAGDLPWAPGKGLLVVRGLCPNWGVHDGGHAKTVWAELPVCALPEP